jgi:hypothetical protein
LWVIFVLLGPDPADHNQCGSMWIRIRIHNNGTWYCTNKISE